MDKQSIINRYDCLQWLQNAQFLSEHKLESNFVDIIKWFYVYGINENRAFIATNFYKVHFLYKKIEIPSKENPAQEVEPKWIIKEIEELSLKTIVKIATNFSFATVVEFALFLTAASEMYGFRFKNKLAGGESAVVRIDPVPEEKLVSISCGRTIFAALARTGNVYWWKMDFFAYTDTISNAQKVNCQCFNLERIKQIICPNVDCFALSDNGNVYSWSQALAPEEDIRVDRVKIAENNPVITSISCGPYHNLFLSDTGDIYITGSNSSGYFDLKYPIIGKLETNIKFKEIGANKENGISIGLSEIDGFCYVFGEVGDQIINEPLKTEFTSIEGVIAHYLKITNEKIVLDRSIGRLKLNFDRFNRLINTDEV